MSEMVGRSGKIGCSGLLPLEAPAQGFDVRMALHVLLHQLGRNHL